MELYIFNRDIEFKGVIDNFTSLIWRRRYSDCGEFELHCAFTTVNLNLLIKKNLIYKKDNDEFGVITYKNFKTDAEGKEVIVVKGKFGTSYMNRRIALGTTEITDTAENTIRSLIYSNAINPTDTNRILPGLVLGTDNTFTESIDYTLDNKELLEDIENIANTVELGIKTSLDITNKQFTFNVYKGLDRSVNQAVNPICIFSKEFDNILEQEYVDSLDNYKNVATDGTTTIGSAIGLDRFETYASKDLDVELSKSLQITTFDSKINLNSNLTYKVDFDLGDIVTCVSKKWGLTLDSRITEIEEIYEESGLSINVVFGNSIPTLIDKIKQKLR